MTEIVTAVLLVLGGFFALTAGLGILRMPDVLVRMQASTKAGTLGAGLILAAVAVYFNSLSVTSLAVVTIVFLLVTAPVAAHMIGRAAYLTRVPLWDRMVVDETPPPHADASALSQRRGSIPPGEPPQDRG